MRKITGTTVALIVLAALLLVVGGVATGAALFAEKTPASLAASKHITTAPVTKRNFDDKRTVDVAFSLGVDGKLSAPAAGLVTAFNCEPGGSFVSGQTNLSLDGQPVLNLATSAPLWRDLKLGMIGPDVASLHAELARLGYGVSPDSDRVEGVTFTAVSDLFAGIGADINLTDTIPFGRFLWLPYAKVATKACTAAVAAPISPGDAIASTPGVISALAVSRVPDSPAPGARVLVVDEERIALEDDGRITASDAIAKITTSSAFAEAVRDKALTFSASWVLQDPLSVWVIPPSALYNIEGQKGCVALGKEPFAVTVIGSELGQSFVTFDAKRPPSNVDISSKQQPPCA